MSKIGKNLKTWYFALRSDPDALVEIRQLALGILVCLALFYAGSTLLLAPRKAALAQKVARAGELRNSASGQASAALSTQKERLTKRQEQMEESLAILQLKKKYLRAHWEARGSNEQFSKVVFTLLPSAPIRIEQHLDKISQGEPQSAGGFTIQPVHLKGEAKFEDIFLYLQYLENSPEVSGIDGLVLEAAPPDAGEGTVRFEMTVNRMFLEGK
ncbi:MAG: hypothetical protein M0017_06660 [Desulfobacteraceae bacterium]|nr:hypothetical protein [Desulfobacteraceae bacterium]